MSIFLFDAGILRVAFSSCNVSCVGSCVNSIDKYAYTLSVLPWLLQGLTDSKEVKHMFSCSHNIYVLTNFFLEHVTSVVGCMLAFCFTNVELIHFCCDAF